ncbi:hypothetical protein HY469_00090 [Candidatus Roizmanbacteria bacterium]|nr:hypothetical protein [Candidatus Roizmanbacteria bacterium]
MSGKTCEYACRGDMYAGHSVRSDADTEVQNDHFGLNNLKPWQEQRRGCLLKVFNDGEQLPVEYIDNSRDITCVGPDSPECPVNEGFGMGEIVIFPNLLPARIKVARLQNLPETSEH